MNIIILTSSLKGSGSLVLEELLKVNSINIKTVIFSRGEIKNKKKHYKRRIKKMLKIGLLGTLNGIRMRKWYSHNTLEYLNIKSIDELCSKNNINFQVVPSINCTQTIEIFKNTNADIGLSLGNGYIGSKIFNLPKFGMINIHHEELPAYQNAQSIIWQIYNNSSLSGYTIHKINKQIDKGDILFQEKIPLVFRDSLADTVSYNYALLWKKSAIGLIKVLENFEHYQKECTPQKQGVSYTTPNIFQFIKIVLNFNRMKKAKMPNKV